MFLAVVRFHILVGVGCVAAGAIAMLIRKGRGRHSSIGTIYYWCLMVIVATATGLSVVRWANNYHLFFLGMLSLMAATNRIVEIPTKAGRMPTFVTHPERSC
jgi:uncharacterized membrane protein